MKFRKHISAILAGSVLAGCCITPAAVSAADTQQLKVTRYGDATMDGSVDVSDAVLTARYVAADTSAKITDNGKLNADVTLDGNVDSDDITQILEFIAKKRNYLGKEETSAQGYKAHSLTEGLTAQQVQDKAVDDAFVKSQYDLTAKLMKQISFDDTVHENILLSPLSIASALALTANGANGDTRSEMEKLLGGTLSMEELNEYYHNYLTNLPGSDKAKLNLANSLWNSEDLQIRDDYLQTVKNYYGDMDVFKAPFTDETRGEINDWISDKTEERITDMLKKMDPNAVTYLINALAFDAEWENAWTDTADGEFSDYNGTKQDVTLMKGTEKYYISDKNAEGFIKPYSGGTYSFVGILPRESKSVTLSDYIGMLDGDTLQNLLSSRTEDAVQVSLPKFSYDYETGDTLLGQALQKLGMKKAFSSGAADFSRLYEAENYEIGDIYIGRVLHNTFIDVNETGTSAAAATIVEMTRKGLTPTLNFDRPFLFMIIDERTQLPVFIGSVRHPEAGSAPAEKKTELNPGEARFSVLDADTDELIPLSETAPLGISTALSGGGASTGPLISLTANPCIITEDIVRNIGADNFSMSVFGNSLPEGYEIPEKNSLTWEKNSNGSFEVTVELKKTPEPLNKNEVRFTVVDADTGKLVPWNGAESFTVNTDIRYDEQDGWITTGPIAGLEHNTEIVTDLAGLMNADYFAMWVTAETPPAGYTLEGNSMSWKKHDNGSWDVVIMLKKEGAAASEAALPALNPDEIRFTVVDADTGKRIQLPAASYPAQGDGMYLLIEHNHSTVTRGYGYRTYFGTNPFTVMNYAKLFDQDSASLEVKNIPAGYTLPENDWMSVTKYDNGSCDVVIRLHKRAALKKGEVRFSVIDANTGTLVPLTDDNCMIISTHIEYNTEHGTVYSGPVMRLNQNLYIAQNLAQHFSADSFSMAVSSDSIPAGYSLPKDDFMTYTKYDNGSCDVTIKLDGMPELQAGEVRFTVKERNTGKPVTLNSDRSLLIYTDYIEQPENPVIGLPVHKLDENGKIIPNYANCCDPANNLHPVVHLSDLTDSYTLTTNDLNMTKHANGSYDVLILLDKILYDING